MKTIYPWRELKLGECFFVPSKTPHTLRNSITSCRTNAEKRTGRKFSVETMSDGVLVRRKASTLELSPDEQLEQARVTWLAENLETDTKYVKRICRAQISALAFQCLANESCRHRGLPIRKVKL